MEVRQTKLIANMDKFPAYEAGEISIQRWLDKFELRYRLLGLEDDEKAGWCRSVIGESVAETLDELADDASYDDIKASLVRAYGATDAAAEAAAKLQSLTLGTFTLKELAAKVKHLTNISLRGAEAGIRETHSINAR